MKTLLLTTLLLAGCTASYPDPSLFPGVGYDEKEKTAYDAGFHQGFEEGLGYKAALKDLLPAP